MQEKVVAIIQARMSSSRLPGKVLMHLHNKTILNILVDRVQAANNIDQVIVATSINSSDNPIKKECDLIGVDCFRGSLENVLERYYFSAKEYQASVVVRITADCPLIDPAIIDKAVAIYKKYNNRYLLITNRMPLTFPDGMDVDVMSIESLKYALYNVETNSQKEHVIPFFYQNGLEILNFELKEKLFANIRLTLDYLEDYQILSIIAIQYGLEINLNDIYKIWKNNPELFLINKKHIPLNYYENNYINNKGFLHRKKFFTMQNNKLEHLPGYDL